MTLEWEYANMRITTCFPVLPYDTPDTEKGEKYLGMKKSWSTTMSLFSIRPNLCPFVNVHENSNVNKNWDKNSVGKLSIGHQSNKN